MQQVLFSSPIFWLPVLLVTLRNGLGLTSHTGALLSPFFWHHQHFVCISKHPKHTLATEGTFIFSPFLAVELSSAWHQPENIPHCAVLWHYFSSNSTEVLPVYRYKRFLLHQQAFRDTSCVALLRFLHQQWQQEGNSVFLRNASLATSPEIPYQEEYRKALMKYFVEKTTRQL